MIRTVCGFSLGRYIAHLSDSGEIKPVVKKTWRDPTENEYDIEKLIYFLVYQIIKSYYATFSLYRNYRILGFDKTSPGLGEMKFLVSIAGTKIFFIGKIFAWGCQTFLVKHYLWSLVISLFINLIFGLKIYIQKMWTEFSPKDNQSSLGKVKNYWCFVMFWHRIR